MKTQPDPTAEFTLRQLEIFCTVAQTRSLTRAAKQLNVRQPSISQQLSRMEEVAGGKLVRYVGNELLLTSAGQYLLGEAAAILAAIERTNAGLAEYFEGRRGRLVVGALPSVARNLLPAAATTLRRTLPGYELDLVEVIPREASEQLQARTLDAAIVSTYAPAQRVGLKVMPVMHDRQLLAVPLGLPDLGAVHDPERDLAADDLATLRSTVAYAFGSDHTERLDAWYEAVVPGARSAVRCRSFESALAFVEGARVCAIVPELAVRQGRRTLFAVALYEMPVPPRETAMLVPQQYATFPAIRALAAALAQAASELAPLDVRPVPPFAHAGGGLAASGEAAAIG